MTYTPQKTQRRRTATVKRRRLMVAAARRAQVMRQSAARSTSALGWLASWDSLTYFVMPVIAGGLLAPLAVWHLPRHIGLPLALSFALWPLLALCVGNIGALIGERRERAWRATLPFSLSGHRAALAGSVRAQMVTLRFAERAPAPIELRRLLDASGFADAAMLPMGLQLRVELRVARAASHDQRAYYQAIRQLIDGVARPLHQHQAIAEVSVV